MPPHRALAAAVVAATAAYAVAGCGAPTAARHARPSLRATIILKTPVPRLAPGTGRPSVSPTPRPSPIRLAACHPSGKAVPVRNPDARTTTRVTNAWRRIDGWLARHAPRSAATLRPPASDDAISRLQARLGHALSPDLVAALRIHDGADATGTAAFTLPPFNVPSDTVEIRRYARMMCGIVENGGTTYPGDWKPEFTPFAEASDGGVLYADEHGHVGEYVAGEGARTNGYPASYAAFLETTATLLETGRPDSSGFRAHVHDGALDWKP